MLSDPACPLFDAAALGQVERVRELLAAGADPNLCLRNSQLSPLSVAVEHDHFEIVELLVSSGASIRAHDDEQSLIAVASSLAMVRYLLAQGASPTSEAPYSEAVVDAIASEARMSVAERATALRLLVEHGADLDARFKGTITLLWRLACNEGADAVDAALRAGADPCTDPSALAGAVWGSFPGQREHNTSDDINRTIDLLVAAGADVHERDERGWQPLHGALMEYSHGAGFMSSDGCNGPAVEALIRHGASIDIVFDAAGCRFPAGAGPLHVAAAQGDDYAVRVLIAAGADRETGAPTPSDLARERLAYHEDAATNAEERLREYHEQCARAARECLRLLG